MASLSAEQKVSYIAIIDAILKASDLVSVSAKQVRKQLAQRVGQDLSEYKDAVNDLIGRRFDAVTAGVVAAAPVEKKSNGVVNSIEGPATPVSPPPAQKPKRSAPKDDSDLSDVIDSPAPKKKRKATTAEDDDAAFAARLQEEENRLARPTRGGGTRKKPPVKSAAAKKKKKSAAKVKDDDDSSKESGVEEPKERKGGFHKPMNLSQPLMELLGETQLSRPQTVKKIWEYVRARDLQDPADKRQIRCDEPLRKVFKSDRVHMFTMNKILAQNLYAVDE